VTRSHRITVGPLGPLIQVGLNVGSSQAGRGLGGAPRSVTGLVDMGAGRTAISRSVYRGLQPLIAGTTTYRRPGLAEVSVATYAVRLNFEGHLSGNPWFEAEVLVTDPATPGVDVLVGMDVISQLVLFYEGVNGTMILTY
jgi:hypothetical protein